MIFCATCIGQMSISPGLDWQASSPGCGGKCAVGQIKRQLPVHFAFFAQLGGGFERLIVAISAFLNGLKRLPCNEACNCRGRSSIRLGIGQPIAPALHDGKIV